MRRGRGRHPSRQPDLPGATASESPIGELERALLRRGVPPDEVSHWIGSIHDRVAQALGAARRAHIEPLTRDHDRYPAQLATIADPPPVLWVRGIPDFPMTSVAIVGSRAATPHALEVAHRLGRGLAGAGIPVVSGLARGVDSAAHRGALAGDGRTIAVLGSGADIVYPAEHRDLADQIAATGAVVSELPPGTPPEGWHFPRRNRIISGLATAVVVVEASESSGSLITAGCALDQGRTVMAVPGGVLSGRNRGAHALLKDGARVVEDIDDVLQELHFDRAVATRAAPLHTCGTADPLLRQMVPGEVYDLEGLTALTGLGPAPVLARLAELELRGLVERAAGGRFVRAPANVLR